jgi:methyl-accepting chemotaxis protein
MGGWWRTMNNLSVITRMYLNFGILVGGLLLITGMALYSFDRMSDRMQNMYDKNLVPLAQVGEIYQRSLQSQQFRLQTYLRRDPAYTQKNYEAIKANRARINELMEAFEHTPMSAQERELSDSIKHQRESIVSVGKAEIDALLAQDYVTAVKIRLTGLEPVIQQMDATSARLAEMRLESAAQVMAQAHAQNSFDRYLVIGSLLLGSLAAILSSWILGRRVALGLYRAEKLAVRVGRGELGSRIEVQGEDEVAKLLRALQDMDEQLTGTVTRLRESAAAVDSAAQRMSEGSDQLSHRTQEQAAALQETAASIEQMTATVRQNADNARQASVVAGGTRDQANQGGLTVQRTVEAMGEITESSRRIEDIIGVIDEIAFQTNLLALNAAVEAARAGEQGRGFAVVASEVRNLAQRSASAAKEIKQLIGDSVGKVQAGSKLVNHSGATLGEIVGGVKKVTDIVTEIASASEEQSAGIEQINRAIANMDMATQKNAGLVDESASAAKAMRQQAQMLQQLLSGFSVWDGTQKAADNAA